MNMQSRLRGALALGVSSTALLIAAPSMAQNAPTGAAPAAPQASEITEVVVTAEKRTANIQNVPLAVTAFTAKQRAIEGINSVQDLTNFTPGLVYSSQLDRPAVRGLDRLSNLYTADSSVGVYDNDLFTNSTFLVGRDDLIVDQVEVLEGPQNTLYGRNAIGGIINTQSKRPSDTFGGEIRETYGNYDFNKIEGTVTGPVPFIPNLDFRLSAYDENQDGGYYKNLSGKDLGGIRHDPYVEVQLQYKLPKDDFWLEMYDLSFNGDRSGPGALIGEPQVGPYDTSAVNAATTLFYNPNYGYSNQVVPGSVVGAIPGGNPSTASNRVLALSQNTKINVDAAWDFNFHWTHHFDGFDMKYVDGFSSYNYALTGPDFFSTGSSIKSYQLPTATLAQLPLQDYNFCGYVNAVGGSCAPETIDGNLGFNNDIRSRWWSQELDFTSTGNGPLSWIAGLYYYNETEDNKSTETASTQSQLTSTGYDVIPFTGVAGYLGDLFTQQTPSLYPFNPNQVGDFVFQDYQDRIQTTAGFGQVSYKLTPTLKATVGLRYTYDRKTAREETNYIDLTPTALAPGLNLSTVLGQYTPALNVTSALVDFGTGKGIGSATTIATSGQYVGDAVRNLADESSAVTGTAALEWTPDRDTLAYARYNRGYKAFGFNAGYTGYNPEAKPEYVNDFEIGLKQSVARNIQVNFDAFYYDYENDQIPLSFPQPTVLGPINLSQFVNIPKAVSDGVEMSIVWVPVPHWNMNLTYGLDHTAIMSNCATFTTPLASTSNGCFIDPSDPFAQAPGAKPAGPATTGDVFQSVKGNELPQAPENKIAFNTNYTWFFDPGNLTLSGSYIWRDHSFSSIFSRNQYDYAPSWSQVDLRATWAGNNDHYEVVLYVKNLFDTLGYDVATGGYYNAAPQGGGSATYNAAYDLTPPRTFGGELHYKF